jgi:hypothetical protein
MKHPATVTPRIIAKKLAQGLVAAQVGRLTNGALRNYTDIDTDNIVVEAGVGTVSWLVSEYCSPITDKIVDKTADFVNAKREARRAKKIRRGEVSLKWESLTRILIFPRGKIAETHTPKFRVRNIPYNERSYPQGDPNAAIHRQPEASG